MSQSDPNEIDGIIRELSEPLAAIVSNAQAGRRMGAAAGIDAELVELLSDLAEDGKRAGELVKRLDALLTRNER